jgi:DNA-directed RNA polymerase subunit RPC12/RpoP
MTGELVPCPRCAAEQLTEPEDAGRTIVCWECGERFPAPGRVPTVRPRTPRRRPTRRPRPAPVSAAAVLSLVLGASSCVLFCVWPVSLATSVAGIITGAFGRTTPARKLAVSGMVLSAVGLIFGVGFLALTIAGISLFDPKGTGNVPPPFFPANP